MVIVVKAGGRALSKNLEGIVEDLAKTSKHDEVVFIHGGGDSVTEMCRRLGIEPKFVTSPEGIRSRYTDENELKVYVMVMSGEINKAIVSKLIALGCKAVGISGADGPTLIAERKKRIVVVNERGRKVVIDGGYTGRIVNVNTTLLKLLTSGGYVAVVSPVAIDLQGTLLNVDGDQAAYAVATAMKARELILLTDVDGVIINGELVKEIKLSEVEDIANKVGVGMNRKVLLAGKAVSEGVSKAVISSGLVSNPIESALAEKGTVIVRG